MTQLLFGLLAKVSMIIVLSYVFSFTKVFSRTVNSERYTIRDKILIAIFFGAIGIFGTYSGIKYMGAIVNNRVIGVAIGGLIGGPLVGFLAGVIAGGHRFLIDIGGFTAFSCALSTITEGVVAGYFSRYFYNSENKISFAFLTGLIVESLQMIIILLTAKPFADAVLLVESIALPMILVNAFGIAIIIGIIQGIRRQNDLQAAIKSQMALKVANQTLPYFSKGLTKEAATEASRIIREVTNVDAVAITDRNMILAHSGVGDDHHVSGEPILTKSTQAVLDSGQYTIASSKAEIGCNHKKCKLHSAIISPLMLNGEAIGTLKLYNTKDTEIKQADIELVLGLASLFSTQLELSKLDEQAKRLAQSELKALQAQINPHFLFNALNTINALIRINPDDARKQLTHLADYFRHNLQFIEDRVSLGKELKQIQSYLEIEKARYRDNLTVEYDIRADLNHMIPPLVIQPLVENSIKHGIFKMKDSGKIKIVLEENAKTLFISVSDDGIGIDAQLIPKLLEGQFSCDSVGLFNTHRRLQVAYGNDNGLKIQNLTSGGTSVTISIPKAEVHNVESSHN